MVINDTASAANINKTNSSLEDKSKRKTRDILIKVYQIITGRLVYINMYVYERRIRSGLSTDNYARLFVNKTTLFYEGINMNNMRGARCSCNLISKLEAILLLLILLDVDVVVKTCFIGCIIPFREVRIFFNYFPFFFFFFFQLDLDESVFESGILKNSSFTLSRNSSENSASVAAAT